MNTSHMETRVATTGLQHLIERLADNKYWLGRRYAEWCSSAPTLESAVAAAAMAQDEVGHARSYYPLLRQFIGFDVEPEDRGVFSSMAPLDEPFRSWSDFVAANFLLDTALTVLHGAALESSFDDLRHRARRITGEEELHWLHGRGWVRRLSGSGDEPHAALEAALLRMWPHALMWFGADDDEAMADLQTEGVVAAAPAAMRTTLLDRVCPVLTECKLALPFDGPDADGAWRATGGLPWGDWDRRRYRLEVRS